jgi:hypothetical protein
LRERAPALGFTYRIRLYPHGRATIERPYPYEIAGVGHGSKGERSHQALANAQLRSARSDGRGDESAVCQLANGIPVHDDRYLRRDGDAIDAKHEYQRTARRRNGTMEIVLGRRGRSGKQIE